MSPIEQHLKLRSKIGLEVEKLFNSLKENLEYGERIFTTFVGKIKCG